MKFLHGLILVVVFVFISPNVMAGGDQHGKPDNSYITVPDGTCVTIVVEGVDLEKCTLSEASPQSGLQAWICPPESDPVGDPIVICVDVNPEEDVDVNPEEDVES